MAPRNTRTGASATTRKASAQGRSRASSSSRSRTKPATPAKRRGSASGAAATWSPVGIGRWWVLPAAIVGVLIAFSWAYYPVARVQYRETREKTRLEAELASLKSRNARLRAQVERLQTPEGVEDYARSQLGLVKKGEHVVVVTDGKTPDPSKAATPTAPRIDSDEISDTTTGPWTAFLDLVFGVQ